MHRTHRYVFSSLVLSAVLFAPAAVFSAPGPQDDRRQEEHHQGDKDQNRVYDRYHKDYHHWDDREDHAYRGYLQENHREYRPISELKQKDQRAYWNWRHSHPDRDHDGG